MSLYIPRIDFKFTKTDLKRLFEEMFKSTVTRVDFVSFNNDKGVGRGAYIHFEKQSPELEDIYRKIQTYGNTQTTINTAEVCESITLLINKKPVPETTLNINQVAANMEFIADQVKNQQETIDAQKLIIAEQQLLLYNLAERLNYLQGY